MRYSLILLAVLLPTIPVITQQLPQMHLIGEPELAQDELVGVRDVNGRDCAAVQVLTDLRSLAYDAYNGVVRVDHAPGRDMVFLSPDERVLEILHADHERLKLILSEIGIQLKPRQVWRIRLTGEQKPGRIPVVILSDPPGAEISIDSKRMGADKQQTLSSGSHELRLAKDGYQPVIQRIQVDENNNLFEIKLEKEQDVLVQIDSKPSGAAVFLGEIKLGETPVSQFFPAGRYRLRLVKEWYVTYEDLVDIQPPKVGQTVTLQEDFASLTVNSAPESRLTIYLDGIKQEEQTPHTFARLRPGIYRVHAQSEGYETAEENLELKRGEKRSLQLASTANFAELTIKTHANAKVTIDGREVKQLQNIRMAPSVVLVRAELPKAKPVEERVVLHKGERRTIDLYPQVPTGTIQVAVVPFDAQIELQGDMGEYYTAVGGRSFSDIPIGRYVLKVSKIGYEEAEENLELEKGEKLTQNIILRNQESKTKRDSGSIGVRYKSGHSPSISGEKLLRKSKTDLDPLTRASANTVTDIDGNVYKTVQIGNQIWMAENLKVSRYRNGDSITKSSDSGNWTFLQNGAYCYYSNQLSNLTTYGCLYNWFSVNDPRGLAPEGWHVPNNAEWQKLIDHLGGYSIAGSKLKEKGTAHWRNSNDGTDEFGFCALPGGYRRIQFANLGEYAYFWSSSENDRFKAWLLILNSYQTAIGSSCEDKRHGFSVRCVKD